MIKWLKRLFKKEVEELPSLPLYNFAKPKRRITKVFIHCSASDNIYHDNIETITRWHKERGFKEIGYHYYINKQGIIFEGRSLEKTPASQKNYNLDTIAICLGGLKKANFTEAQFTSLKSLCKAMSNVYNDNITFHGHKEVANKECPVFDYKAVLQLDEKGKLGIK